MSNFKVLSMKCPRCGRGRIFRSLWRMHDQCSDCKLVYDRGPGYFFGAMYFSYGLGIVAALPTAIVMFAYQANAYWVGLAVVLQLTLLSPLLFRYSRVLWMSFDQWIDPR